VIWSLDPRAGDLDLGAEAPTRTYIFSQLEVRAIVLEESLNTLGEMVLVAETLSPDMGLLALFHLDFILLDSN
jgi:hypothetical protein